MGSVPGGTDRPFEPLADRLVDLAAVGPISCSTLTAGSKPFVPPSIATCTATRSASPPHAGWRAPRSRRGRCSGDVTMSRISWTSERVNDAATYATGRLIVERTRGLWAALRVKTTRRHTQEPKANSQVKALLRAERGPHADDHRPVAHVPQLLSDV